ncbi:MAG: hypothetical protein ACLFTB_01090 [Desulfovibrionales bacterium]
MGCNCRPEKGLNIGDLRKEEKKPLTITLSRGEVNRMMELLKEGPQEFDRTRDIRLMAARLATWHERKGFVQATDESRPLFLLPDGTLSPQVKIMDEDGS